MRLKIAAGVAGVLLALPCLLSPYFVSPCSGAEPEVRGTWLTTTANDAISTPAKTAATMRRLREIGLNTVYIECWKEGFSEFPSSSMEKLVGVPIKVNAAPPSLQRDLLQEGIIQAHRNGLLAIAWFEYGFMAAYKTTDNPLRTMGEKQGWLLRNREGSLISKQDDFVWMNPLHPRAQEILLNVVLDAARKYDLDGIQLDDRISMPTQMGYDSYTKDLYARDHHGDQPPADPLNPEWIRWRAGRLTDFARRFTAAVHKANPRLIVSVSPAPYPWCYQNFACNWPEWMKWTGPQRWDECVTQNYRYDLAKTKASIAEDFPAIGNRRKDLLAGILVTGEGKNMSASDVLDSIRYERASGLGGHVLWFSRGVLDLYPQELTAFYDVSHLGQASNPQRPADWRPLPIVATPQSAHSWKFTVDTPGRYTLIAKKGDNWFELESRQIPAGPGTIEQSDIDALELLIDHRN
jgi:uncharacterized lipoprotein YddW (UPF0748 family)